MLARQWIALSMLFAAAGCGLFENPITCNPGPSSYQVNQARRFDPYPDPTTGPAIVGGRPIDFMEPRPEPDVTKNPRFWLAPGTAYPQAPAYVAPPAGTYPPPVQAAPAMSYAAPPRTTSSAVVPATAMVPIPPPAVSANSPAASGPAAPVAYGTTLDGP